MDSRMSTEKKKQRTIDRRFAEFRQACNDDVSAWLQRHAFNELLRSGRIRFIESVEENTEKVDEECRIAV